ncbi:MAG: hypothetical protein ACT4PZ_00470 [Panacagrimonas sp.]
MERKPARLAPKTMLRQILVAVVLASPLVGCGGSMNVATGGSVDPQPTVVVLDMQRGRLLYDTACVACHTTQAHWRDNSIVGSWSDVVAQVERWQTNAGQQWGSSEIGDVAAYLNAIYYRMPCSTTGCRGESNAALDQVLSLANEF